MELREKNKNKLLEIFKNIVKFKFNIDKDISLNCADLMKSNLFINKRTTHS